MLDPHRQPMMRRANALMTNATYTHPAHVETYVMSYADLWTMPIVRSMVDAGSGFGDGASA